MSDWLFTNSDSDDNEKMANPNNEIRKTTNKQRRLFVKAVHRTNLAERTSTSISFPAESTFHSACPFSCHTQTKIPSETHTQPYSHTWAAACRLLQTQSDKCHRIQPGVSAWMHDFSQNIRRQSSLYQLFFFCYFTDSMGLCRWRHA